MNRFEALQVDSNCVVGISAEVKRPDKTRDMEKAEIDRWAAAFASELEVAGERVPIARVIAAHAKALTALRAMKLTWRSITAILLRAGVRRDDGQALSADQLRAEYSRCGAEREPTPARAGPRKRASSERGRMKARATAPAKPPGGTPSGSTAAAGTREAKPSSKDVSDNELAAALAKIKT